MPSVYVTCKLRDVLIRPVDGDVGTPTYDVSPLSKPLAEAIYRDVGAIVAYGDHVKSFLTQVPGVEPDKIFVAGQVVEPDRFESVQPSPKYGKPVALFIGAFEERKGVRDLLDAFARVSDFGPLRMVGNGALEDVVRRRAAEIPGVSVAGYVSQESLPAGLPRELAAWRFRRPHTQGARSRGGWS